MRETPNNTGINDKSLLTTYLPTIHLDNHDLHYSLPSAGGRL
jgi:hypothetical protein